MIDEAKVGRTCSSNDRERPTLSRHESALDGGAGEQAEFVDVGFDEFGIHDRRGRLNR